MPSRNIVKLDADESYYHVYARGINKQDIYDDPDDYIFFLSLFARYLSHEQQKSPFQNYPHLRDQIKLLCYCVMPNHFHLLVYQCDKGAMAALMRSVMTSYSRYYNQKHGRRGAVFETTYKASRIDNESYLLHISRYIHLNPRYWKRYPFSSVKYYTGSSILEWLQPEQIQELFGSVDEYRAFLDDYVGHKKMLEKIKKELAQ